MQRVSALSMRSSKRGSRIGAVNVHLPTKSRVLSCKIGLALYEKIPELPIASDVEAWTIRGNVGYGKLGIY
jgi:hypothetical protein